MSCDVYCNSCGSQNLRHYCQKCFPIVSQQELDAARLAYEKCFLSNNKMAKQLADAREQITEKEKLFIQARSLLKSRDEQIKEYSDALEEIKKDTEQAETTMEANAYYLAEEVLNKWKVK